MRDLATIQRRFYELVTAGEGTIDPGLLGSSRRLDVYADAYVARLHDVLADDYPKLRAALGDNTFREVVASYVRACPPTSFTIRDAGLALPRYVATRDDLPGWAADLAALERARVDVFDGADATALSREDLAAVPIDQFPELALALIPASVVVPIGWSIDELWSSLEDDTTRETPVVRRRSVLVWRRELRVLHRTLDGDEAELVPLLASGASVADLSDRLAELVDSGTEHRMVELLARWVDAAVVSAA